MNTTNDPSSAAVAGRRAELAANSVVVSYIHEISDRHRPTEGPFRQVQAIPVADRR